MKQYVYLLTLAFIFNISCKKNDQKKLYTIQKQSFAEKSMVVSAHPLATKVGVDILKSGGNAVDAAIAVQFALAVCYPVAGNIGGGGFMMIQMADGQKAALDFREKAPMKGSRDMYLDIEGNVIPRLSMDGHLAAGVPGTVAGMFEAFEKFSSTKDMNKLISPSIEMAERGFKLTKNQASYLNKNQEGFIKFNTQTPIFVNEKEWEAGSLLKQKDLAQTLRRIRDEGVAGFYEGATADLIVSEMEAGNGIISYEDLKKYKAIWREPIEIKYKDLDIISMPPPSSGGIALGQMLNAAEMYDFSKMKFQESNTVHLMAEIERRVYADRAMHLGDSDFYNVPSKKLLNKRYMKRRMNDFDPTSATSSDSIEAGNFAMPMESTETTHFSIVDFEGNAVSVTTTLNGGYGSKTVVSGAGFLLNNEMDDFSAKPGVPNMFGLIGNEANSIAPEKRMLSSMTPTIVTKDGKLYMVLGTPGGSTIITSIFQAIINVKEFGMSMSEAVSKKRFHHQWLPDKLSFEKNTFTEEQKKALEDLGHVLREGSQWGQIDAILIQEDGTIEGAADPRADNHAEGF